MLVIAGRTMENAEKEKGDEAKQSETKQSETKDNIDEGEMYYLKVKASSNGFSQWEALSPIKRRRYEAEAKQVHPSMFCNHNKHVADLGCVCVIYCQNYTDLQLHNALYFTFPMRYLEFSKKHSDLGVHSVVEVMIWLLCFVELPGSILLLKCQDMLLLGNHSIWSDEAILLSQFVALTHDDRVWCGVPSHDIPPGVSHIPLAHVFTMARTETVYCNVLAW